MIAQLMPNHFSDNKNLRRWRKSMSSQISQSKTEIAV